MTYPFKIKQEIMPRPLMKTSTCVLNDKCGVGEYKHDVVLAASALTSLAVGNCEASTNQAVVTETKNEEEQNNINLDEVPMTFPQKLMDILAAKEHSHIIGWLDHGRAFIIYEKRMFASEVLPLYFRQSKFTSFTRKMSRWGFMRIKRGHEAGAYYHKCFQRDNPRLCMQMTCQSNCSPHPGGVFHKKAGIDSAVEMLLDANTAQSNEINSKPPQTEETKINSQCILSGSQSQTSQHSKLSYEEYSASIVNAALKVLHQSGSCMSENSGQHKKDNIKATMLKERMDILARNLRMIRVSRQKSKQARAKAA